MRRIDKKGAFGNLQAYAVGIGLFVVVTAVVLLITTNIRSTGTVSANANATEAINMGIRGISDLVGWTPVLVVVLVGSLLIALVVRGMGGGSGE